MNTSQTNALHPEIHHMFSRSSAIASLARHLCFEQVKVRSTDVLVIRRSGYALSSFDIAIQLCLFYLPYFILLCSFACHRCTSLLRGSVIFVITMIGKQVGYECL
jgi:hypothetical protein